MGKGRQDRIYLYRVINMLWKKFKPYIYMIILTEAVGALAGFFTRDGMKLFENVPKSALTPPNTVFPVVWGILYLLMAVGAARIIKSPKSENRTAAQGIFAIQLVVNFFWSLFFFNLRAYGFSFVWLLILWALIIVMIYRFSLVDKKAAWLQVPYILWVTFAAYLNFAVWWLNT